MIVPTPRLLVIALLGLVAIALTGSHDTALGIAALWLVGILLIALIDAVFVPATATLTWRREHADRLSLGAWNRISLVLTNSGETRVQFRVRDAVPNLFVVRGEIGEGICSGGETWRLSYEVFPLHRGDYPFGTITARYLGPLGLVWRQRTSPESGSVRVYPNLLALRNYEALVHRGQLAQIGLHSIRRWGEGTEFERLRAYTPDDEFRRINWKATARHGEPIVVDYQVERSQNIILAIDAGRLMATRLPLPPELDDSDEVHPPVPDDPVQMVGGAPIALTRLDYSLNTALLLAFVSQEYGDRVGLLAFSDRVTRYVAPRGGRRQFVLLTEALYNLEAEGTATDYGQAIAYLAGKNPRRSLIVCFTDFTESDAADQLVRHLALLAPRHVPLVVTLKDPSIAALADQPVDTPQHLYERAVAQRMLDERAHTLAELRRRGSLTLDVTADQISSSVINRYLEVKGRGIL